MPAPESRSTPAGWMSIALLVRMARTCDAERPGLAAFTSAAIAAACGAAADDVVAIAAVVRGAHERRELAKLAVELVLRTQGHALRFEQESAGGAGEHFQAVELRLRVPHLHRRLLLCRTDIQCRRQLPYAAHHLHEGVRIEPQRLELRVRPTRNLAQLLIVFAGCVTGSQLQPSFEPLDSPLLDLLRYRRRCNGAPWRTLGRNRHLTRAEQADAEDDRERPPGSHDVLLMRN